MKEADILWHGNFFRISQFCTSSLFESGSLAWSLERQNLFEDGKKGGGAKGRRRFLRKCQKILVDPFAVRSLVLIFTETTLLTHQIIILNFQMSNNNLCVAVCVAHLRARQQRTTPPSTFAETEFCVQNACSVQQALREK